MNAITPYLQPGTRYTHYKRGGEYEIMYVGYVQSDTVDDGKQVVVYRQIHDHPDYPVGTVWVRTVEMFFDEVEVKGDLIQRFQLLP